MGKRNYKGRKTALAILLSLAALFGVVSCSECNAEELEIEEIFCDEVMNQGDSEDFASAIDKFPNLDVDSTDKELSADFADLKNHLIPGVEWTTDEKEQLREMGLSTVKTQVSEIFNYPISSIKVYYGECSAHNSFDPVTIDYTYAKIYDNMGNVIRKIPFEKGSNISYLVGFIGTHKELTAEEADQVVKYILLVIGSDYDIKSDSIFSEGISIKEFPRFEKEAKV